MKKITALREYIPLSILFTAVAASIVAGGVSYSFFKYSELKEANHTLKSQLEEVANSNTQVNATATSTKTLDPEGSEAKDVSDPQTTKRPYSPPSAKDTASTPAPVVVSEEKLAKPQEEEEPLKNGIEVDVSYTKQTAFYNDEYLYYQYGYGGYQIVLSIQAIGEDILIPQTATDNGTSVIGFEYEVIGSELKGDYELDSEVNCPLREDGLCKFKSDKSRPIEFTVYFFPEVDGIYGVKFLRINYLQNGEVRTYELGESTSKINVRGVN